MISFLSSNISSRSDCTQLFSFIVKKEDKKDTQLFETEKFLALMKGFVLKGLSFDSYLGNPFDGKMDNGGAVVGSSE